MSSTGADGGQADQPAARIAQHLRDHRQQPRLRQRFDHPLPEQDGPAGGEGEERSAQGLLSRIHRDGAQPTGNPGVHGGLLPGQETRRHPEAPVPPLHHGHQHGEHQAGVPGRQGHHPPRQPQTAHAPMTPVDL